MSRQLSATIRGDRRNLRALAIIVIVLVTTVSARGELQEPPASPAASQRYQFSACLRPVAPLKPHELDCVVIEGRGTFEDCGKVAYPAASMLYLTSSRLIRTIRY
jgi:hypothetical protein